MRKPLVKVCGLTTVEDALFASGHGADILGVVRSSRSPRKGTADTINELSDMGLQVAGIYTDMETAMNSGSREQYIQLHFQHGKDEISSVRKEMGRKAISVVFAYKESDPLGSALEKIRSGADLVLLEYGSRGFAAGTGILPEMGPYPIGVAGRVSTGNLRMLLGASPYFIDVSSSLEQYPGKKDRMKIVEFMEAVRYEPAA